MDIYKLGNLFITLGRNLLLILALNLFTLSSALAYQLVHSPSPTRLGATPLNGAVVAGNIYTFIDINAGLKSVAFAIDGTLTHTEGVAPWDLAGTESNTNSKPYNTAALADGVHQFSAILTLTNNSTQTLNATVTVKNQTPALTANPSSLSVALNTKTQVNRSLSLQASDAAPTQISLASNQPWLSFSNTSGTAPFNANAILDASLLSDGSYIATITASASGYPNLNIPVTLNLQTLANNYALLVSSNADRSGGVGLGGQQVSGLLYVYLWPETNVKQVRFFIDNPSFSGTPYHSEGSLPFDLVGTAADGKAIAFNAASLSDGVHSLGAEITHSDNSLSYVSGTIKVGADAVEGFLVAPQSLAFAITQPATLAQLNLDISYSGNAHQPYSIASDQPWLTVAPNSGITPTSHTLSANASLLQPGTYSAKLTLTGVKTAVVPVTLTYTPLATAYTLQVSQQNNRSNSVALAGTAQKGNVYIHLQPETDVASVAFFVDRQPQGTPDKLEGLAPYDLAGTASSGIAQPYNTISLSDGSHFIYARVTHPNNTSETTLANFQVNNNQIASHFVLTPATLAANLSNGDAPTDYTVQLGVDNNVNPDFSVTSNVPWASVTPVAGTAPASLTVTLNPSIMQAGSYQGLVSVSSSQLPAKTLPMVLNVSNNQPHLLTNPSSLALTYAPNSGVHTTTIDVSTSSAANVVFNASSDSTWLTLGASSGTTPQTLVAAIDTQGLAVGSHSAHITLNATGYPSVQLLVNVNISNNDACAPVICSEIRVGVPYSLEFDQDKGHLLDGSGQGTGFTYLLPASKATAYVPNNIALNTGTGVLRLTTTNGIAYGANNNQTNALGIGFAAPNQVARISTQLNNPANGTGKFEQAGLWFGVDEDNYVKLVYNSLSAQPGVEFVYENAGKPGSSTVKPVGNLSSSKLQLILVADPSLGTVTASYVINSGAPVVVGSVSVDPEMFSFDAAGIDPLIGTRSFAGLMATHRNGSSPINFEFEYFRIEAVAQGTINSPVQFTRIAHPVDSPTNMAWAPDGKLYVIEMRGKIHALSYDANLNVVADTLITSLVDTLGQRLALGMTIHQDDPNNPNNYSLWIGSSSPSLSAGAANSSVITRLSGPGFTTVENIITGLPRAIANHAVNSLHFGPDNRLYIAVGGNTGAGAPVAVETEFGDREEQPLSAAVLVANVFAAGFDGSCANIVNIYGPAPCDVVPFVTGLRNSYDFVFHTNGEIYATDNGLGVTGAYPRSPTPDCSGLSNSAAVNKGGNNPGSQDDLLLRLQQGKYYGHPNPSRNECIFKDGSLQGVPALPNYMPAIASPGRNASANGIVEYTSDNACGKLRGNLLITRYSLGDDILRVQLAADGKTVVAQETLVDGFNDPLTITERNGDLFVAELGGGTVTALRPQAMVCEGNH